MLHRANVFPSPDVRIRYGGVRSGRSPLYCGQIPLMGVDSSEHWQRLQPRTSRMECRMKVKNSNHTYVLILQWIRQLSGANAGVASPARFTIPDSVELWLRRAA